ncbi:tyrosine-protein phosphatase [Paenibacillus sp. Soil522]|uniref:tyrosine-protein phosphatase n=1 Tax=Paenibacillus sp. Soil522 TaxID=1736388 RepID=UPI0006FEAD85|nr:CpsB/CapC family capsule biosynthesis tyrosine phosphatase [Paenibacillus sp. Soil522]KRE47878.1 protein tyrosine phosphatase [Paenibacillus sp. Soil522]
MIDIHTHILPGLDDGAACTDDTLIMARAAVSEGITTIIATPHHANGAYTNTADKVAEHTHAINEQLMAAGVPVTIMTGQEVRVHDDLLDAWHRSEILPLASSCYLLVEMPSSRIPKAMLELIHELSLLKLKPIIAHPERNAEVVKHPERLAELIEAGAFAQVTTHSLLGGFGKRIEQSAWSLMKDGLIHIVSSDAHHVERRGFRLREAYASIERRMGEQWVSYLQSNAQSIIEDKPFHIQPAKVSSSKGAVRRFLSYFYKN